MLGGGAWLRAEGRTRQIVFMRNMQSETRPDRKKDDKPCKTRQGCDCRLDVLTNERQLNLRVCGCVCVCSGIDNGQG